MSKTKVLWYLKVMISKFCPDVGGHEENGWAWAGGGGRVAKIFQRRESTMNAMCISMTLPNGYWPGPSHLYQFVLSVLFILIEESKMANNQHFQKWSDNIWTWHHFFQLHSFLLQVIHQKIFIEIPSDLKLIRHQCF